MPHLTALIERTQRHAQYTPHQLSLPQRVAEFASQHAMTGLRLALAAVFIWFGALKVADQTPVTGLVEGATPWPDPSWFVPVLGSFEVFMGLWLMVGRQLALANLILIGHLMGTFSVLVFMPDVAFIGGKPLLLSTEGEFVAKNIVLIAAALAIGAPSWARSVRTVHCVKTDT